MSSLDVEFNGFQFGTLTQLICSAGPIPVATVSSIGSDRLITRFEWSPGLLVSTVSGVPVVAGTVIVQAPVRIHHLSAAELLANPAAAPSTTNATAWVRWSVDRSGLLTGHFVRIDANGRGDVFSRPSEIGRQRFTVPRVGAASIASAALLWRDDVVTIRFCTSITDDVLAQPLNSIADLGMAWGVRISDGLLVDMLREQLTTGLAKMPPGTVIEDPLTVVWKQDEQGVWGASADVGIEKLDACPGLLGAVDISVALSTRLTFSPDLTPQRPKFPHGRLGLRVVVESDTSDWDSFRCWAGIAPLVVFASPLFSGVGVIALFVGSLIAVSAFVAGKVSDETANAPLGSDFQREPSGDDDVIAFVGAVELPQFPGQVDVAEVRSSGLVFAGGTFVVVPALHHTTFTPD
ncbi:MAG TPA: hypothetical protein PLB25_08485 [Rhodoferax sp.]|nr:hypothetical protein [Rhodoferax sp.]